MMAQMVTDDIRGHRINSLISYGSDKSLVLPHSLRNLFTGFAMAARIL